MTEATGSLAAALLAAQAEMPTAKINKTNPHFKNKYADLEAVREACIPVYSRHGVVVTQFPNWDAQGRYCMTTRLTHAGTGEFIEGHFPLPDAGKPQEIGAAATYMRRYGLVALAGLTSEEDDDGESAGTVTKPAKAASKQNGVQAGKGTFSPTNGDDAPAQAARATDMTVAALNEAYKAAIADIEASEGDDIDLVGDSIRRHAVTIEQIIRRKPMWWTFKDEPAKGMRNRILAVINHSSVKPESQAKAKRIKDWLTKVEDEANPEIGRQEANNSEKEAA